MGVWFNNQPYTSFQNVNSKKGRVKLTDGEGSGYSVVLEALSLSADRTISFRDLNGSVFVGLAGTMTVNLEDIAAGEYYHTAVTITGLTSNDAVTWGLAEALTTGSSLTIVPCGAMAATNTATLIFGNASLVSTNASQNMNINYTVIRL